MQTLPNASAWREFRLARAISMAANTSFAGSRTVEEQVTRDYAERTGAHWAPAAFSMPYEALFAQRDMSVAGVSGSQFLVGTEQLAVVDTLHDHSVLIAAGAQRLDGLRGNVVIPRTAVDTSGYWLADENTAITPAQPQLGQISLTPKTASSMVTFSKDLGREPAVEAYVRSHLRAVVAELIDTAALQGTGTLGQPQGLVASVTNTVSGTSIDWSDILAMEEDVRGAKAQRFAWIGDPAARKLLAGRERAAGSGFLWGDNGIAGQTAYVTASCPANTLIAGAWENLIVATWGGIQLDVDPYTLFSVGHTKVRVMVHVDCALLRPGAFSVASGLT